MSATALQLNLELTANECYQRKVQALQMSLSATRLVFTESQRIG